MSAAPPSVEAPPATAGKLVFETTLADKLVSLLTLPIFVERLAAYAARAPGPIGTFALLWLALRYWQSIASAWQRVEVSDLEIRIGRVSRGGLRFAGLTHF